MSVATERPSLLELAAEALARQREMEAEEASKRLARNRENLLNGARGAVEDAFGNGLTPDQVTSASYRVLSTDDLVRDRTDLGVVGVELLGARFEFRKVSGYDQWGLYHQHECRQCGAWSESEWPIRSLAGLGEWIVEAQRRCSHSEEGADDGAA